MERATTMDRFDEKIIGYESIKNILRQILDTLKRPELYKSKGASIPRGLLMESDPGLGKSLLATVFIKESGRKSYVFRKTSQENSFLDELRAAFSAAKEAAPSILLLEDLNLYVESNSPYAPEWACLQACIDDAKNTDIFVIATTNDTKYMPPSLLRPGRFDYTLYLEPPTGKTAEKIVSYYLRDKDLAEDTSREKLVLSGSIQNDGETVYKNKDIHFSSAIMNCKGTVRFINCAIHYNEDEVSRIFLGDEASLQIESSTVICHGDREKGFFIQSIENSKGLGTCTITNSTFVDNLDFIKGKFDILDFNNNLTQGLYYPLMDIKVKTSAKIRNSRFLSHTPSFAKKYSKSGLDRQDELLYLHNESDYDPAEILIDNDVFVGKEKFDFAHSEEQKEHRMIGKSEEQEELLAIKGPSSKLFRYNKDAMGTVSNCTFTNMGKCVSGMDTVTNCIFDGCSYAVDECCYKVKESRFYNCALACQKLFGQAVVSNCQFVNCKGEELITSGLNAEVKVEDCEFSNIRLVEDGFTYYFRSMIVFGTADSKFANAGRWSEVNRCIFNGICISRKSNRTPKSDEHAYVICAQVTSVDKFKFARARVADCTFTNCASVNSKLINTEPYDSLFGKKHNYMAVSSRNNSGLNDIGDPSSFVASSNVKLKETDANGNKIGSSLSVN